MTLRHQQIRRLWMGWDCNSWPKDFSSHIVTGKYWQVIFLWIQTNNSRNYSLITNAIFHLVRSQTEPTISCRHFSFSRPRTERCTQAASTLWLLIVGSYFPCRVKHWRVQRATPVVGLGSGSRMGMSWDQGTLKKGSSCRELWESILFPSPTLWGPVWTWSESCPDRGWEEDLGS